MQSSRATPGPTRGAILPAPERVLVPAGAALEPALRPDERLDVGPAQEDRGLGVPGEDGPLRDPGEEELDHGREPLHVRLLVDDELEDAVGDELHVRRQEVVAAAADGSSPPLLEGPAEGEGAEAVDRDRSTGGRPRGQRRLDLPLPLPDVAGES